MPVVQTMIDDAEVGRGFGEYFKSTNNKQRIAIVPHFKPLSELEISPELQAAADKQAKNPKDLEAAEAATKLEHILKMRQLLKDGAVPSLGKPARTKKMTWKGVEGYRYCRMDSGLAHYDETVHYYYCKAAEYAKLGREAACCKKSRDDAVAAKKPAEYGDAQRLYAFVVLVYSTDIEGNVLTLASEAQRPLDDHFKMDFKYEMKPWAINDAKMKGLKLHKDKFPPIISDYEVWTQKHGQSERVMFNPCNGTALWLERGSVLESRVLDEAEKFWSNIARTIGKDLSIQEIDELCGIAVRAPAPQRTEQTFSGLLS